MRKGISMIGATGLLLATVAAHADSNSAIPMHWVSAEGGGEALGQIDVADSEYGLLLTPSLEGLEPGVYGLHVHTNPSCEPAENADGQRVAALAAGGHYDPDDAGHHAGPYGDGHLGDLPPLAVAADGTATTPLLAPRLSVDDLSGRSLMLHAGGDNFSDDPAPLGGGGARRACGVAPF